MIFWKYLLVILAINIFSLASYASEEEPEAVEDPDFYSATGLNQNRSYDNNENIYIDTFSGSMQAHYTDIVVPGVGGLDIAIQRSYSSSLTDFNAKTSMGSRWRISFGQLIDSNFVCDDETGDVGFNGGRGAFVKPDGSVEPLLARNAFFIDSNGNGTYEPASEYQPSIITPSLWRVRCKQDTLVLTDTNGTSYYIGDIEAGWNVVKVEDVNGNYYEISYEKGDFEFRPKEVTTSDGRRVEFNYKTASFENDDGDYNATVLDTIKYKDIVVKYNIELVNPYVTKLKKVIRPDGSFWEYGYNDIEAGIQGQGQIKGITNPFGLQTTFKYENINHLSNEYPVIKQKCVDTSCWDYSYSRAKAYNHNERDYDITTVTGPDGVKRYDHYGFYSADRYSYYDTEREQMITKTAVWQIGLLKKMTHTYDGETVLQEDNSWTSFVVASIGRGFSIENGASVSESAYRVPVFKSKRVIQDDSIYNYEVVKMNKVGWPEIVKETGTDTIYKKTSYTLRGGKEGPWVLKLPYVTSIGESLNSLKEVSFNEYNEVGQVIKAFDKGVMQEYDYYSNGNLKVHKDGEGHITGYSNYNYGVARRVDFPDGGFQTKTVDHYGRIKSITNSHNITTYYDYDEIGRLIYIDNPITEDVTIDYQDNGKTVVHTRGNARQTNSYNNKMLLINKRVEDLISGKTFIETYDYDELDRLEFKSRVNDDINGVKYEYDPLNRLTKTETTDGRTTLVDYIDGETRKVTNARGFETTYTYKTYSPTTKLVEEVEAPENVVIETEYNELGQPLSIKQNGIMREYGYNEYWQLNYYKEPEKDGHMTYVYDLTGRTKEAIHYIGPDEYYKTLYKYDEMGRLEETTYPAYFYPIDRSFELSYKNTCQVSHQITCNFARKRAKVIHDYDLLGQLKSIKHELATQVTEHTPWFRQYEYTKSNVWIYDYDDEGRLREESFVKSVEEGSEALSFVYGYNELDYLESITYPTGNTINYSPDVFGRPTQAGSFVTSVEYYDSGSIKKMVYGNGQVTNYTLNDQLLPETMTVGKAHNSLISFTYDYDDMGNLNSIINELDSSKSVAMTYDGLDRLLTANGSWGVGSFDYDELGNIENKTIGPVTMFYSYDERNRLDNFSGYDYGYDIAGRVTTDEKRRYFYDHANNLINATSLEENGSAVWMDYDGNNRLIQRRHIKEPGATPDIKSLLYTQAGKLMHEIRSSGDFKRDHVYLGNKLVGYFDDAVDCMADFDGDGIPHCYERENGLDPYSDDANLDKDGDGLTNLEEYQLGSRADISDTDGDGIPDGFEAIHGLNVLVDDAEQDFDNDGISNLAEYHYGSSASEFNNLSEIQNFKVAGDSEYITVLWKPVQFATGYKLFWSDSPFSDLADANVVNTQDVTYYHKTDDPGKDYHYRVLAYNSVQETEPSNQKSAFVGKKTWGLLAELDDIPDQVEVDLEGNVFVVDSVKKNNNWVVSADIYDKQGSYNQHIIKNDSAYVDEVRLHVSPSGHAVAIYSLNDEHVIKVYDPALQSWEGNTQTEYRPSDIRARRDIIGVANNNSGGFAYLLHHKNGYGSDQMSVRVFDPEAGWSDSFELEYSEEENSHYAELDQKPTLANMFSNIAINEQGEVAVAYLIEDEEGAMSLHLAHINDRGEIRRAFTSNVEDRYVQSSLLLDNAGSGHIVWFNRGGSNSDNLIKVKEFNSEGSLDDVSIINVDSKVSLTEFVSEYQTNNKLVIFALDGDDKIRAFEQAEESSWVETITPEPVVQNYTSNLQLKSFVANGGAPQVEAHLHDYIVSHYQYINGQFEEIDVQPRDIGVRQQFGMNITGNLTKVEKQPDTSQEVGPNEPPLIIQGKFELSLLELSKEATFNIPPIADAGNDFTVDEFVPIELDGSLSSDPDGTILESRWACIDIPAENCPIIDTQSVITGFVTPVVDDDREYTFLLTITDDAGVSDSDVVTVLVRDTGNVAPVADAGQDRSVMEGETVLLGLNDSYDPDGNGYLSYSWGTSSGGYLPIEQAPEGGLQFVAPQVNGDRTYSLRLTVTDPEGASSRDTVQITIVDLGSIPAPIADAGQEQTHPEGEFVILDGTRSYDPSGGDLEMSWSVVNGGDIEFMQSPYPGLVGFQAPEVEQTTEYVFRLTVTNSQGISATDDVMITIIGVNDNDPNNLPPIADAGPDQTINEGTLVILDGGNSHDPDGDPINFTWSILSGGPLPFEPGPEQGTYQFIAPNITPSKDYVLELAVTDSKGTKTTDEVTITIIDLDGGPNNIPPVADAGVDQVVNSGDTVVIDPRYSYDPDGFSLSLSLSTVAGGYLPIETGSQPGTYQFVAPEVSSQKVYTLRITVTDADGASDSDDINVTVMPR